MATNEMLMGLLKTPSQVRKEAEEKLAADAYARSQQMIVRGGSTALPGIISGYGAQAAQRGAMAGAGLLRGISGGLGQAVGGDIGQRIADLGVPVEERQARMGQEALSGVKFTDPASIKAAADKIRASNPRAAALLDARAVEAQQTIDKVARDTRALEQTERLNELKIQKAEKELSGKTPPKIGAINPQDFTPSSIAKFAESGDYNDLDEKIREKEKVDNRTPQEKNLDRYLSLIEDGKEDEALKFGRASNLVPEMSTTLQKDYLESSQKRQEAAANVLKYTSLADDIKTAGSTFGGGADATWTEFYKEITGSTDAISELRTRYRNVRASNAMQNLPPGAASDADVALALQGVPPENANAATVESFLRGLAKLERYVSDYNTAKLKYMDENQDIVGFETQWIDSQQQTQPTTRTTASGVTYTIIE